MVKIIMIDLKNVKVDFPPNSAYAVLYNLVQICGIDSVMSAFVEIITQQEHETKSLKFSVFENNLKTMGQISYLTTETPAED